MPGSMNHLLVANKVKPEGSTLFYLGSIAPDAVKDWHDKDISHFRNLEDRQTALTTLAQKTEGDFAEGVLLHLYFDWKWDTIVRLKYIEKTGDDWFAPYRNELSLVGSYAFHHTDWARQVWNDMDAVEQRMYGTVSYASAEDIKEFVSRNNKWHKENIIGPSPAFPPDLIEDFTEQAAEEYVKWRITI